MSTSVACRRGAGRRLNLRVACPSTKSCTAGTDSRVIALWMPRDRGKLRGRLVAVPKIEQRTFAQLQMVDVLAVGEVYGSGTM